MTLHISGLVLRWCNLDIAMSWVSETSSVDGFLWSVISNLAWSLIHWSPVAGRSCFLVQPEEVRRWWHAYAPRRLSSARRLQVGRQQVVPWERTGVPQTMRPVRWRVDGYSGSHPPCHSTLALLSHGASGNLILLGADDVVITFIVVFTYTTWLSKMNTVRLAYRTLRHVTKGRQLLYVTMIPQCSNYLWSLNNKSFIENKLTILNHSSMMIPSFCP